MLLPDVLECECGLAITTSIMEEIQQEDGWRLRMVKAVHRHHHFHKNPSKKPFVHIIEHMREATWREDGKYQIDMYCECHTDFIAREYVDREYFVLA